MEHRYCVLRAHLDELGYKYSLSIESVPLVERLLSDLVKTTESLQHYKNIAQSAIEERDNLQLGAEPYKCDNAKLIQECNDLHQAFLQFREQTNELHKNLKRRINMLEKEKQHLENEKKGKSSITKPGVKQTIVSKTSLGSKTSLTSDKSKSSVTKITSKNKSTDELEEMMSLAEQRISNLGKEVKKLKTDHLQQIELIESLQYKLSNREKEINRLTILLEGGRPLSALNKDCCYKDINAKLNKLTEENIMHIKEKNDLEMQLAECVAKQHEAMKRALHLAEKNKQLERELRDIDQIALAVEADCNSAVKNNSEKISELQDKLNEKEMKIEDLERQLNEVKRNRKMLESDLEAMTEEKENFQKIIESALQDKKKLTDRINQFTRIEQDLNFEIDRLVQVSTLQKRKIAELECQMVSEKLDVINGSGDKIMNSSSKKDAKNKKKITSRCYNENIEPYDLKKQLHEREEEIRSLNKKIHELTCENHHLLYKCDRHVYDCKTNNSEDFCSNTSRIEKERDLARADVRRLEIERDALRERLQSTAEASVTERAKLECILSETENKLRNIESERRELITVQGTRRATINKLEEQVQLLSEKLCSTQTELNHLQSLYGQIRTLQEQTDRALLDTQAQLTQLEIEYTHSQDRVRELELNRAASDNEISCMRNELAILKSTLAKIDSEKDELVIEIDNKTETIGLLEQQLKCKDSKIVQLETSVAELKQTINLKMELKAQSEQALRNANKDLCLFRKQLEELERINNNITLENKRIQSDLCAQTNQNRGLSSELDKRCKEVDDLKRQLQEYVCEVKRIEDLLCKKEDERSEMLDQFRSLSHEATLLENNNHCLESQAMETKCELSKALMCIDDMKHKMSVQDTMLKDYDSQICKLTSNIASMETQIKQNCIMKNRLEAELYMVKETRENVEKDKNKCLRELTDKDSCVNKLKLENADLRTSINCLEESLECAQTNIAKLEQLLSCSRQDTIDLRLENSEHQGEMRRLTSCIDDLKVKNTSLNQQLETFQEKALDYSLQLKQLRREIANERFNRIHSGDTSNRYPSL